MVVALIGLAHCRKPKVVAGLEDLGLFNEDEMAEAVRSITWPHK